MDGKRFIHTIRLDNILSYGPDTGEFALEPLNVLIGPNASGKSNLIEVLALLAEAPRNIQHRILLGGGAREWIWKGSEQLGVSSVEVTVESIWEPIRYRLSFTENAQRFVLVDEVIEKATSPLDPNLPYYHYSYKPGKSISSKSTGMHYLSDIPIEDTDPELPLLAQLRGADPKLTYLANHFERIQFYSKWDFPKDKPPRQPGRLDLPRNYLSELGHNLSSVMNSLLTNPGVKNNILLRLKRFYPDINDIVFDSMGNSIQMFFHEGPLRHPISATRMSDGSLRYLCLLAILCHPDPPPVICIEEPEVGLHPDIIAEIADLLIEASERSQIIVTTHSDALVDALTDTPESIVICEKQNGATRLRRVGKEEIESWLEDYRLGEIWMAGQIGGTRW